MQLKNSFIVLSILLFVSIVMVNCGGKTKVSESSNVSVEIIRFEKELFSLDIYQPEVVIDDLLSKYPDFMALFAHRIINIGDTVKPLFITNLNTYVTDKVVNSLYERSLEVFSDFSKQKHLLLTGLGNYKVHFPEKELPNVYTYISGLNQSVVTGEEILGVSIDKYLGAEEPLYNKVYPPIPQYLKRNMEPNYVATDALRGWVASDISFTPVKNNFLSKILHEARIMYIAKQIMPDVNDTLLWGFSNAQLQFCEESESEMWKYLIEQKILFSTDNMQINKFIEPGPFTKDFTMESPARAGVWLGYRIIEAYMVRNKDVSLSELAEITDFQYLLNESRYNP